MHALSVAPEWRNRLVFALWLGDHELIPRRCHKQSVARSQWRKTSCVLWVGGVWHTPSLSLFLCHTLSYDSRKLVSGWLELAELKRKINIYVSPIIAALPIWPIKNIYLRILVCWMRSSISTVVLREINTGMLKCVSKKIKGDELYIKQHYSLLWMEVCVYIKSLHTGTVVNKEMVRAMLSGVLLNKRIHTINELLYTFI